MNPKKKPIGRLGDITFIVSRETVRTLSNMKWSGSANYAVHQRHGGNALTEFTGLGTDLFSFSMTLTAELGVDPMEEIRKLWKYERTGEAVPLNIGRHAYGRFRWSIIDHKTKIEYADVNGDIYACDVAVQMREYLRE